MVVSRCRTPSAVNTSWIRFPFDRPKGRRLKVLIYARYSTEEQNPRSIEDQVQDCRRFLEALGLVDAELQIIEDRGVSGEILSRKGINQVRDEIAQKTCHLILAEDASRLYRNEVFGLELVGKAVDREIRVVCVNDCVDTADEDNWVERLHEALRHHATANQYTSRRIKRSLSALWEMGAAIGLLKPGYLRLPSVPATEREPAKGPFFDKVAPRWAPAIEDAFARIAAGESPDLVATRLTTAGLPKTTNSKYKGWTKKNVIDLIRRTDYRGYQRYRTTVSRKHYGSGKHVAKRNKTGQIPDRDMPHLRIVSDALWYRANAAIDARRTKKNTPQGNAHPLTGIPRDSHGPLSKLFICGACGEKMHVGAGKAHDHRYRCSSVKTGRCWNRATALRRLTHDVILQAVVDRLPDLRELLVGKLPAFEALAHSGEQRAVQIEKLEAKINQLKSVIIGLVAAIEARQDAPQVLVKRLVEREEELAVDRADLEQLRVPMALPSAKDIDKRIAEIRNAISPMDREAREVLAQLLSPIRAFPCRQFGGNKIVLRAKFTLSIGALVPPQSVMPLANLVGKPLTEFFETVPVMVDLFEPSLEAKWSSMALPLSEGGLSLEKIGRKLGISKRAAHLAVQYGRKLREAGLTDPYIELTDPPQSANRWRSRKSPPTDM